MADIAEEPSGMNIEVHAGNSLHVSAMTAKSRTTDKPDEDTHTSGVTTTTTVVDAIEHIEGVASPNSLDVPKSREMNLRDFAKIINMSDRFLNVTPEQVKRVRIMHDRFEDGAEFSFNYNVLLLVASILAGLGLASNSSTIIIASMLVSKEVTGRFALASSHRPD